MVSSELEIDELVSALSDAPEPYMLGGVLLKKKIGEGAAGSVYTGTHTRLNVPVAVKVLKQTSPEALTRFIREARLTVSMEHPNLVRVYDVNSDEASGLHYIVMEFVEGYSAYELLERSLVQRRRALSLTTALQIVLSAARAMAVVHASGIVHRDIKPDNLLIRSKDGVVKLADLGLAAPLYSRDSNEMVGTTGFLSPEVLLGEAATPASDVYALGASLYELLTGVLPHGNEPEYIYYDRQLMDDPIDPRKHLPGLDDGVVAVMMKCLRRDPEQRYASATELQQALEEVCSRISLPQPSRSATDTAILSCPTVMVVDDDESVLELMRDALEASGFKALCCNDPVEALRRLPSINPDVAVLDRNMPRLDGVALCRLLRQQAGFADLPVLMLSGDQEEAIVEHAIRGGIDDYLFKPAKIQEIVVRVRLLSRIRSANRERRQLESQWQAMRRTAGVRG
ncbi:MAG TPA: protein kinase [Planctomycetota bacterium]|nr:protein kinase [Planctomycetota bacterium]